MVVSDFKPSERLEKMKLGGMSRFFALAREMPGCISLSIGEPDFSVPRKALDAGWRKALGGKVHYEPTNGISELREALAENAQNDYGLDYDLDCEVLITVGGSEAIAVSFASLLNPSDEVMLPNPGFVTYEPSVLLAGGVPIGYPLLERNGFKPVVHDVMSLVTDKSRVMLLNFPNNPTGAVPSHKEGTAIARLAVKRDMIVISDEVYEKIVYDGAKHSCMATFPGMRQRTLIINSFSKTYAMTGLRVGFVFGPKRLIAQLWLVHQYTVTCVDSLAQYIALAALEDEGNFTNTMVKECERR